MTPRERDDWTLFVILVIIWCIVMSLGIGVYPESNPS